MSTLVLGLYDHWHPSIDVIEELIETGLAAEQISLVATDPAGLYAANLPLFDPGSTNLAAQQAQARGESEGKLVGGLASVLLKLGAHAMPGTRPLVALGPILRGLTGAAPGAILAILKEWGLPEAEAELYAEAVRRGSVLVAVMASEEEAGTVSRLMDEYEPVDVARRSAYWRAAGWTAHDPEADCYSGEQVEDEQEHYAIYETYEPIFRDHFQAQYGRDGRAYRDYAPAYFAGYILGSDMRYRAHTWEQLEPEARRRWQTEHSLAGAWEEMNEAVRYAWEEVREDYYGEDGKNDES
jgi:hypothetical protein